MTKGELRIEVARIDALGEEQKREALPAFRATLRAAGLFDFVRAGQYVGRLGTVNIRDIGSCGLHISYTPAAEAKAAARQRAQRDRIRKQADAS